MPRRKPASPPAAAVPLDLGSSPHLPAPLATALLRATQAGIVLILLTPFLVSTQTLFPFVVGKSLYWRTLVEIVFGLWAVLALWQPEYRPPRSWLLGLLGASFACSLLAAFFGVSPQRSLWSTYERMQGVVDGAHVLAFAVVATSVFRGATRPGAQLRLLLAINIGVSTLICLAAAVRFLELDVPFFGRLPERDMPRIGSTLGNPIYLAAYTTLNATLALGFLLRSLLMAPAGRKRWTGWLFWLVAAVMNCAVVPMTMSRSGALGALAAAAFLAFGGAFAFTRIRPWKLVAGFAAAGVLAAALGLLALSTLTDPDYATRLSEDGTEPMLPIVGAYVQDRSSRSRLAAWHAAVQGFVERPLLGWGPENFLVVFGRFQPGTVTRMEVHDLAHNKLLDEATAKGLPGLAAYLALWLFAFYVLLRATRRVAPPERALALFVGAALMGYFAQSQTLFDTVTMNVQYILLVCYAVWLEVKVRGRKAAAPAPETEETGAAPPPTGTSGGRAGALVAPLRIAAAVAAIALTVAGLVINQRIFSAASLIGGKGKGPTTGLIEEGMAKFSPLAGEGRIYYFGAVQRNWRDMRMRRPAEAKRVLGIADAEAEAAVAAEPENWLLHHHLARMYLVVSATEPGYLERAARHIRRAYELAPKHDRLRRLGQPLPRLTAQDP